MARRILTVVLALMFVFSVSAYACGAKKANAAQTTAANAQQGTCSGAAATTAATTPDNAAAVQPANVTTATGPECPYMKAAGEAQASGCTHSATMKTAGASGCDPALCPYMMKQAGTTTADAKGCDPAACQKMMGKNATQTTAANSTQGAEILKASSTGEMKAGSCCAAKAKATSATVTTASVKQPEEQKTEGSAGTSK